ncbi:LPS-assembly protein LptD [Robiginitomaculum antarcticum]|uniref:LPS-assembly protein LptD n=1 Tax=Robiginitomaculum antarcticum TaxID=437507 RepID=UPI0014616196|nr:LPS assembly protein LptD [Robiginitomaculum antarcticum]
MRRIRRYLTASVAAAVLGLCLPAMTAQAQTLALQKNVAETDSPFADPNLIYLEADQLIDKSEDNTLIARGSVTGRYQTRTLQADEVVYDLDTGNVTAIGNVIIIDADGGTQYSQKIELNSRLESGGATDFVARFPEGGIAAAAFALRRADGGVDLYNAYYTACEACRKADGTKEKPTWRLRARQVTQDKADQMIYYHDAVFEVKGVPIFYTPYLAHPDPSSERRSGFLIPFGGRSGAYGVFYEQPYYWAISPYSELVVTPRIMERVNPLLMADYNKKFNSGSIEIEGSFTYDSFFDNRGDSFSDADVFLNPDLSLRGERLRSHLFARGEFDLSETWGWGFGVQTATDAFYLDRYDIDEPDSDFGLYDGGSRRLVQQAYLVGQQDDFRYSASTFGFQSLRGNVTRNPNNLNQIIVNQEDNSTLPVVLPQLNADHYFDVPVIGGRLRAFGDGTFLTRSEGDDYNRLTAGLDWQRTLYTAQGISVSPFAMARTDVYRLSSEDLTEDREFTRTLGNVGVDARWTFIRPGQNVDLTIEPRVQVTQSFGEAKQDQFSVVTGGVARSLTEDGIGLDLDRALLWSANKSTGFDFWQEGFRADVGTSFGARWDDNRASLFLGQSFASGYSDDFAQTSGLDGDSSDIIAQAEVDLSLGFSGSSRLRFDEDDGTLRRVDTAANYTGERFSGSVRYYKIDDLFNAPGITGAQIPPEEISGQASVKLTDFWSMRYVANRDLDAAVTRREELAFIFNDNCTLLEIYYEKRRNNLGLAGNSSGFGVRVALLTLGDFTPE